MYRLTIEWASGQSVEDIEAKSPADALIKLGKLLKAKQKITGYRPIYNVKIETISPVAVQGKP